MSIHDGLMMSESRVSLEEKANIDTLLIAAEVLERDVHKNDNSHLSIMSPVHSSPPTHYLGGSEINSPHRSYLLTARGDMRKNIQNNHRRFSTLSPPAPLSYKNYSQPNRGLQSDKRRHSVVAMPTNTSDLYSSYASNQVNSEDYQHWASNQQKSPPHPPQNHPPSTSSQSTLLNSFSIPDSSSWIQKNPLTSYSKSSSLHNVNAAAESVTHANNSVSFNVPHKRLRTALLADRLSTNQVHYPTNSNDGISANQCLKSRALSDVTPPWMMYPQASSVSSLSTTSTTSSVKGNSLVVSSTTTNPTATYTATQQPSSPPPANYTASPPETARVPRLPAKKRKIDWSQPDDLLPPGKDVRSGAKMSLPCVFEGPWSSKSGVNGNASNSNPTAGNLIVDRPAEPSSEHRPWVGIHPSDRVRKRSEPVLFPFGFSPFSTGNIAPPPSSASPPSRSLHLLQPPSTSSSSTNSSTPLMPPPPRQRKLSNPDLSFTCAPTLNAPRISTSSRSHDNSGPRGPLVVDVLSERKRRWSLQRCSNNYDTPMGEYSNYSPTKRSGDPHPPINFTHQHPFEAGAGTYSNRSFSVADDGGFSQTFLNRLSQQTANNLLAQQQEYHRRHSSVLPPASNNFLYYPHQPTQHQLAPPFNFQKPVTSATASPYSLSPPTSTPNRSLLISKSSVATDMTPTIPSQHRSPIKTESFNSKRPVSRPDNFSPPLSTPRERQRKHGHVPVLGTMLSSALPPQPQHLATQQAQHSAELLDRNKQSTIQQQAHSFLEQQEKGYRKRSLDFLFTSERRDGINLAQANCAILLTGGELHELSDTSHGFPLLLVSAPTPASAAAFAAATALASGAPATSLIPVPVEIADSPPESAAAGAGHDNDDSTPSYGGSNLTFISTNLPDDLHPMPQLIFPTLKAKSNGSSRNGRGDGPCALGLPVLVPTTTTSSKRESLTN